VIMATFALLVWGGWYLANKGLQSAMAHDRR
jgi:hypothetical protein